MLKVAYTGKNQALFEVYKSVFAQIAVLYNLYGLCILNGYAFLALIMVKLTK